MSHHQYHDIQRSLSENTDGHIIERVQHIPEGFLDRLKAERDESMSVRETEHQRVASIPTCVVEKWISEGYPFWDEPVSKIVAKLKAEGLEYFLTTGKQV
jgi:hypothetical protein